MKVKIEIDTGNSLYTSDVINILKAARAEVVEIIKNENKEQSDEQKN